MAFPAKKYEKLKHLQKSLQISQEDLHYAVENGLLKTSIWLPLRYVEHRLLKDGKFIYKDHEPLEGFVGIRPEDVRAILSHGCTRLRRFTSIEQDGPIFRLADEPPQPPISVRISDLLVLKAHEEEFKRVYKADDTITDDMINDRLTDDFKASEDYRHIILKGMEFHLGDVQGRIIKKLHEAALTNNPWVHSKTLIHESGSQAAKLHAIFSNKSVRETMIISNKRGYYRLNLPLNYRTEPQ